MNVLEFFSVFPLRLTIPARPATKVRHRTDTRGKRPRTFKNEIDEQRELVTKLHMRKFMAEHHKAGPLEGPLALICRFHMPDRRRTDVDNLIKHIMDAGNGIMYADDSQVHLVLGEKLLDRENPRTVLIIGPAADPWGISPMGIAASLASREGA